MTRAQKHGYMLKGANMSAFRDAAAVQAKTLSLQPKDDLSARRASLRTTRNPTGKLRLINYRQIQDQKLHERIINSDMAMTMPTSSKSKSKTIDQARTLNVASS